MSDTQERIDAFASIGIRLPDDFDMYDVTEAIIAVCSRVSKYREALEFYADRNGDGYDAYSTNYGLSLEAGYIIQDAGDIARVALKTEKEDE